VGYIRMSTDKQEDCPAQQKAEITKLAQREGYRIIRWYEDHGISEAKTLKRPEFRHMIRDADDRGDFRAILCCDQERFGRFDSIEAGEWISPLRRAGVELVNVCHGRIDWEDFAADNQVEVFSIVDLPQFESERLRNFVRSIQQQIPFALHESGELRLTDAGIQGD